MIMMSPLSSLTLSLSDQHTKGQIEEHKKYLDRRPVKLRAEIVQDSEKEMVSESSVSLCCEASDKGDVTYSCLFLWRCNTMRAFVGNETVVHVCVLAKAVEWRRMGRRG